MPELKKILIHSNAFWLDSGYGGQCGYLAKKMRDEGYDVAVSAFFGLQGKRFVVDDIPVFPGETYSDDILVGHYKYFGAQAIITLMDVWVLSPDIMQELNTYCWTPVDTEDHLSMQDLAFFKSTPNATPIAMSRHGKKLLARAELDSLYAPHMVDTSVYRPPSLEEYKQIRALGSIDDDTFLVGICAANKSKRRKNWDGQFQAFKIFHDQYPNSLLYIHSQDNDRFLRDGVDLRIMCHRYGINKCTMFSDQYALRSGMVTNEMLCRWYWQFAYGGGVLSAASLGEGFGLPSLEAQACGVPVVVTKASAMKEVGKVGWQVSGRYTWVDEYQANWVQPSIEGLAKAYEQAYERRGDEKIKGDQALGQRAVAHAQNYSIENVWSKFWSPTLAHIESKL